MIDCKNASSGKLQNKHLSRDPKESRPGGGCGVGLVRLMFLCAKLPENETTVPKHVGV